MSTPAYGELTLPEPLESRLRSELAGDEKVLWVAQPRPDRLGPLWLPVVIGLAWAVGASIFALNWMERAREFNRRWNAMQARDGRPLEPELAWHDYLVWLLPLFGVGIMTIPLWVRRSAARTCYALTDRRAVVLSLGAFGALQVKSFRPDALGAMKRVEYADGSGSLIFEEVPYSYTDSEGHSRAGLCQVGFLGINDVRGVEELLRRTLLGSDA